MRQTEAFSDFRWRRLAMGTAAAATLVALAPSSAEAAIPNLDPHSAPSAVRPGSAGALGPLADIAVRPGSAGALGPLADIAVQRILLGDKVAEAKFGTDQPIDDPAREQQELDAVAAMASSEGIDPDASVRFFQAQIEANKVVQRGLYALWTKHPELRPSERPDLATEVRPELDQITTEIIQRLKATQDVRGDTARCRSLLLDAKPSAELRSRLDALHRKALTVALRSVCTSD
ncbi:chorismate mutase [Actinoallomurus bryophytorum]|uniref:chorismate mutase n=1 Tax=Actinoallomurus bryophytorum TaxID=1490222 RepID=UPI001C8ACF27|nr:chorismate mutase [Actinoallomurus bryophytorum]